ncbi:MAG: hypothetical protein LBH48_06265 [Bifidobacteriaceae bacterium]|jgi:hypothetical protein|nr:hypothetical protein [Bifidobacteriaceae bacterium]
MSGPVTQTKSGAKSRGLRGLRTVVSSTVGLVVALAIGVIGANALWHQTVPLDEEVATGSFALNMLASSWSEQSPGIAVADRHGSNSVAEIADQWVTTRGDKLVIAADLRTTLAGNNVAADLIARPINPVPAFVTGTMVFKDSSGQVRASSSLGEELRWTDVPKGDQQSVRLEIELTITEMEYADPTSDSAMVAGEHDFGMVQVALEQTRHVESEGGES